MAALTAAMTMAGAALVSCSADAAPPPARPGAAGAASRTPSAPDTRVVLAGVSRVSQVAQLTGPSSLNSTDRYGVGGTDLGSMFEADGKVWFVFGDTFGDRDPGLTGGGGSDWRSNTMAYTTDAHPGDGIRFDGYVTDNTGSAKELLAAKHVDGVEMTVIPTHGFAANGAMYLAYMSVRHWGRPGEWDANHAGLAKSTDHGETWTKLAAPRWPGDSKFVQVSVANVDGELYFWGITHGRFGGVALMKVKETDVERQDRYRYFAGTSGDGRPQWSPALSAARTIVNGPIGELSVAWSTYLHRWLMTYLDGPAVATHIREGAAPWGPWAEPVTLVSATDAPGLYAPFMSSRYTADGGRTIYFTLSRWDPYNVFWYRADLVKQK